MTPESLTKYNLNWLQGNLFLTYVYSLQNVSPLYCDVYLENIGFVYPAMSMVVLGPSLLH
jgi:hypothetical protein